jgi:hypothetical protein
MMIPPAALRARYNAWWQNKQAGRPLILQITAPVSGTGEYSGSMNDPVAPFTKTQAVIERLEDELANTLTFGDAYPVVFPVSTGLAAIEAAYLGCPYHILPFENTAWTEPLPPSWVENPVIAVDESNSWWQMTQELLEQCAAHFSNRAQIGLPDLQGGGEVLALLRGTQKLLLDLIDRPEYIVPTISQINLAWLYYYQRCCEIIHTHTDGYVDWLMAFSDRPAFTVECDFSALISPAMFRRHFLPALCQQVDMLDRSIYHLDGPEQIVHLDMLLRIQNLNAIQWVASPKKPSPLDWIQLFQRIQAGGKNLVLGCPPEMVLPLLKQISPEGVLLSIRCASAEEAERLYVDIELEYPSVVR